ncbi:phosphohistidine phosphatase [Pedobacter sp. BAL39]|nr:phosphohistidine phosphatase [Pedobacter sp. BAL39]
MAMRLLDKDLVPELIVSSPALRALTTARNFAQVWNKPLSQIREESAIYEANISTLLSILNKLDDKFERVALFGHNPGFTEFANYLSNSNLHNIPTCGVVLIEFPFEEWKLASLHTGSMEHFDYPKSSDED